MDDATIENRLLMSTGVAYLAGAVQALFAFAAIREGAENWLAIGWRLALTAAVFACSSRIQTGEKWASVGLVAYLAYLIYFCMTNPNGIVNMAISLGALLVLFPAVRGLQACLVLNDTGDGADEIDF